MFDLLIRNGLVIDGNRSPRYRADIGVSGDRIIEIGDLASAAAERVIDASNMIVAPGFVEVHGHSDGWLLREPNLAPKTLQGFTTEILMVDGISYAPVDPHTAIPWIYYLRSLNGLRLRDYQGWRSLGDYMSLLNGRCAQNVATHIPYANVRSMVHGFGRGALDDAQSARIRFIVTQGMDEGAVGLSTGLDYISECFATTQELVDACRPMSARNGLYVTHVRYKLGLLPALQEAVEIGRQAKVPVHISHLKGKTPDDVERVLEYIDKVARQEVDFSFDLYPYQSSSTMLNYLLPYEVWEEGPLKAIDKLRDPALRSKFAQSLATFPVSADDIVIAWTSGRDGRLWQGRTLRQYADSVGQALENALCDLLIDENLAVLLVIPSGDEKQVYPLLQHDLCMIATDGIYFPDGQVHPRVYGSVGLALGPLSRDHGLFSLEEAIHKLSGFPARRFRLKDRGAIRTGGFADIVVFDPQRIDSPATYERPNQTTVGISTVLVNGQVIVDSGQPVSMDSTPMPGRFIKAGI